MRICFDARISRAWDAGTGRLTVSLLNELAPMDGRHEYVVALHPEAPPIPLSDPRRFDLLSATPPVSVTQHFRFAGWARRQRFDVVFHPHQLAMPLWSGARSIGAILDVLPLLYPRQFPRGLSLYYRTFVRWSAATKDRLVVISRATRSEVISRLWLDPRRIEVLPLAPAPEMRPMDAPLVRGTLERLGLERPYVLYVGNARPHKNLMGLLRAFAEGGFGTRYNLVIVGREDASERERDYRSVRGEVERLGLTTIVRFVGFVPDEELACLYTQAAALVLVSFAEGFGLPVLEAMACGAPIVCSNQSALAEVGAGVAVMVDPRDPRSIAEGIRSVLDNPARALELREAGKARAAEFSWRRSAHQLLKLFEQVAAEGR